jgi:hypothetical protein
MNQLNSMNRIFFLHKPVVLFFYLFLCVEDTTELYSEQIYWHNNQARNDKNPMKALLI